MKARTVLAIGLLAVLALSSVVMAEEPLEYVYEDAYAYYGAPGVSHCFIDYGFGKWGWSLGEWDWAEPHF